MWPHRTVRLAGLLLLALAGCKTVGPDYRLPADAMLNAPEATGAFAAAGPGTSDTPVPGPWWRLFNAPTLDALVAEALAANTDLRAAEANLARADALLRLATSAREVGVAADASTSIGQASAEAVLQHVQPPRRQVYNVGIGAAYNLDLFGGLRRGIEAAQADREAQAAARDLARINVAAQTALAWADLCNAGHQAAIVGRMVAVQQAELALANRLASAGRLPLFEAGTAKAALAASAAQLPPLDANRRNAAFRLAALLGRPPERLDPAWLSCTTPLALAAPLPVGDARAMLARRPDVRAAERQLAAATARIGVATVALYPDIRLGFTLGSTGAAADLLSPLTNRFALGPLLSWDLHRSAVRARIAAANADTRARLARFDATVLKALTDTETGLASYRASLDQLQALSAAQADAASVAARLHALRTAGRLGADATIAADRRALAAERAAAEAEARLNRDQIGLFLALGGGWAAADAVR